MAERYAPEAYGELADGISRVLFSAADIEQRVLELGAAIAEDYAGKRPLLVGVLKGVFPFLADLMRAITIPLEVDYMAIASYSAASRDQGFVRLQKGFGRTVRRPSCLVR